MATMVDRGHLYNNQQRFGAREWGLSGYKSNCQQINYGHLKADIVMMIVIHGIIDIICNNKYDTSRSWNIVHNISNKRMAAIVLSTIVLYSLLHSIR